MSTLARIKNPLLVVCGLVLATAAILVGTGFVGGSHSKPSKPAAKASGPWRAIADAPQSIAAGRTAIWSGTEMIVADRRERPRG
jgi:hypothetical protein